MTLLAIMAVQAAAMSAYAALAPFIRTSLGLGSTQMGLVAAAPYLGSVVAAFGLGSWVDRRPPRAVAVTAGLTVAASLVVVAVSPWLGTVVLGFLLLGIGRGVVPPLTDRVAYELTPVRQRGFVFGIKQTGTPVGAVLASVALPPVAASGVGWRGAIAVTAVAVAVCSVALSPQLPEVTSARPSGPADGSARPVLADLARRLAIPMGYSFGMGVFMAASMTFLTLFLVDTTELGAVRAARWFALFGVGGAIGRVAWGWLSDRVFGGRRAYVLTVTGTFGGLAALGIGLAPAVLAGALGATAIFGFGFLAQGWVAIVRALGAELAGPGLSGRAGGLLRGSMMFGGLVGPPLFGALVDWSGTYTPAWLMTGTVAVASGLSVLPTARREEVADASVSQPSDRQGNE